MYLGTTLDSSVTVDYIYTGSGSTATVVFKINTSFVYITKNLNLGCVISGSTTTVYSSNTIAFTTFCGWTSHIPSPSEYIFT
jgi:hypothetical protein